MNLKSYIQHRQNLEDLDLSQISRKNFDPKKSNFDSLLEISNKESKVTDIKFIYNLSIYLIIGIFLSFLFSFAYAYESENKRVINISVYILLVIVLPYLFLGLSLLKKVYFFDKNGYGTSSFITNVFLANFKTLSPIEKESFKISEQFHFQFVSFIYSIASLFYLFFYTTFLEYKFKFETSWLGDSFFENIVAFFNIPLSLFSFDLKPSIEIINQTINHNSNGNSWLFFLISITIIWTILPRLIFFLISWYILNKSLKKSFLNSTKSKIILNYIKPETSTTNVSIKEDEASKDIITNKQIVKFDLFNNTLDFKTILMWQLSDKARMKIENEEKYANKEINRSIIYLERVKNLDINILDINSPILILINSENEPKRTFINLLIKLINFDLTIKIVDSSAKFVNTDEKIKEWLRFIETEDIKVEVING